MERSAPRTTAERRSWRVLPANIRLVALIVAIATAALGVTAFATRIGRLEAPIELRWWLMLPIVYLGERLVVHSRSSRLIRSFSLSEMPIVIGLYFASPVDLLFSVALGNLLVLFAHRGQRGHRLAFNVAQFTLGAGLSILVFRAIVGRSPAVGSAGWVGALLAAAISVLLAATLIGLAMRASGSKVDSQDERKMTVVSLIGALVNTTLALIAVTILWFQPGALWLAFFPTAIVFVGYRSYVTQQHERAQMGQLYEASLSLHRSRDLEAAVLAAAEQVRNLVDAEIGAVILYEDGPAGTAYVTDVGSEALPMVMRAVPGPAVPIEWAPILVGQPVVHDQVSVRPGTGYGEVDDGVAVPLLGSDRRLLGVLFAANRLGKVDGFGPHHVELLETLASMLTVVLEKERLEDSLFTITALKEDLEEAVRSKDQFIASISHELRTPLTAVVGLSEELAANTDLYEQGDLDEFLQLIAQQSTELSYIVEDLLVAARSESNEIPLHPEALDLAASVQQVVESQQMAGDRLIRFELADQECPDAFADPLRVRQIVRNLLTNAVRYGGPDIAVEIGAVDDRPFVIVSDDGTGVTRGDEHAIFEAYQRASGGRQAPESIGLGLAVSRQLARSMGGELHYRRREGRTEFVLELPACAPVTRHV
jgi:signal transduction histidine kinase